MSSDKESRADERLVQALAARGYADAREPYRARMREFRQAQPGLFDAAKKHYAEVVEPAISGGDADPVEAWAEYGRFLGELEGPGRIVAVDPTGLAVTGPAAKPDGDLLLFVPEDRSQDALPLLVPAEPSRAQRASYDLLVLRRLSL